MRSIFFAVVLLCLWQPGAAGLSLGEVEAMADLQVAFAPNGWTGPASGACQWVGVNCSSAGHVTVVNLDGGDLTAATQLSTPRTISSSIGALFEMQMLILYGVGAVGAIPDEICNCTQLYYLSLGNNQLTGQLPDCIGQLSMLATLLLNTNEFVSNLPPSWANLTNLHYLWIQGNPRIGGPFPEWIGMLSHLEQFDASSTNLSGVLPATMASASTLNSINFASMPNMNGGLPGWFKDLPAVTVMSLSDSNFSGPLPPLCKSVLLQTVDISNNHLSGPFVVPPALTNLVISNNLVTAILPCPTTTKLLTLIAPNNQINGTVATLLMNFSGLTQAWLSFNKFTALGQIPNAIACCKMPLAVLDLHSNQLNDTIDRWVTLLPNLELLRLTQNPHFRASDSCALGVASGTCLPAYLTLDPSQVAVNLSMHYQCPGAAFVSPFQEGMLLQVDGTFYNYSFCQCVSDYYGLAPNQCRKCLAHAQCLNGTLEVPRGYAALPCRSHHTLDIRDVLPCLEQDSCNPDGNVTFLGNAGGGLRNSARLCATGRTDRLCSRCQCDQAMPRSRCYFSSLSGVCTRCRRSSQAAVEIEMAVLMVLVALFFVAYSCFPTVKYVLLAFEVLAVVVLLLIHVGDWWYFDLLLALVVVCVVGGTGTDRAPIKALVVLIQVQSSFGMNWPEALAAPLNWLYAMFNMSSMGLPCVIPHFGSASITAARDNFLVMMLTPLILMIFLLVADLSAILGGALRHWAWRHITATWRRFREWKANRKNDGDGDRYGDRYGDGDDDSVLLNLGKPDLDPAQSAWRLQIRQLWQRWSRSILLVLYLVYFDVSLTVIGTLSCQAGGPHERGSSWMATAPWIQCRTSDWWRMIFAPAITFFVLYVIGIPALFGLLLAWNKSSIQAAQQADLEQPSHELQPASLQAIEFLYQEYRPGCWWGEFLWIGRRVFLAFVLSFIPRGSVYWGVGVFAVLLISVAILSVFQPYAKRRDNYVDLAVLLLLMLIFSGVLAGQSSKTGATSFVFVCLALNAVVIGVLGYFALQPRLKWLRRCLPAGRWTRRFSFASLATAVNSVQT